ncbi:MAG: hypothetical protein KKG09_06690 [Verrucomicrobia bacterium]|nr:hypothetical protein [Verrucomicrobiota bacterium]MCG2681012.1 hypothetical protein [Kiritimatiellia bacterium]MBU4247792.1 hypothetical protein [Verrucomicrobiota bacterium]MBU4292080.1 hypothetical protein [Verrucomicrobiota bacterium]MBU4428914.1 hypothetical protein [Verrucomicrobiota bacterium]
MNALSVITLVLGALILGWHLVLGLVPKKAGVGLTGFPRNIWAGRILAAVAVVWVAFLVWQADIAWLERYRLLICVLSPVAYVLVIMFVDELLAVRALGGLFLLFPALILDAAFGNSAPSRLVMTVVAYGLVIMGMILVWSPYMFRKMTAPWAGNPRACRIVGAAGSVLGLGMVLLGWFGYQ